MTILDFERFAVDSDSKNINLDHIDCTTTYNEQKVQFDSKNTRVLVALIRLINNKSSSQQFNIGSRLNLDEQTLK